MIGPIRYGERVTATPMSINSTLLFDEDYYAFVC